MSKYKRKYVRVRKKLKREHNALTYWINQYIRKAGEIRRLRKETIRQERVIDNLKLERINLPSEYDVQIAWYKAEIKSLTDLVTENQKEMINQGEEIRRLTEEAKEKE